MWGTNVFCHWHTRSINLSPWCYLAALICQLCGGLVLFLGRLRAIVCICREWCTICVCKHCYMPQIGVLHQKCQNSQNHSHMLCCIIDVFTLDAGAAPPPSPSTSSASNPSPTSPATLLTSTQSKYIMYLLNCTPCSVACTPGALMASLHTSPYLLLQYLYGYQGPSWLHSPYLLYFIFSFFFIACKTHPNISMTIVLLITSYHLCMYTECEYSHHHFSFDHLAICYTFGILYVENLYFSFQSHLELKKTFMC